MCIHIYLNGCDGRLSRFLLGLAPGRIIADQHVHYMYLFHQLWSFFGCMWKGMKCQPWKTQHLWLVKTSGWQWGVGRAQKRWGLTQPIGTNQYGTGPQLGTATASSYRSSSGFCGWTLTAKGRVDHSHWIPANLRSTNTYQQINKFTQAAEAIIANKPTSQPANQTTANHKNNLVVQAGSPNEVKSWWW